MNQATTATLIFSGLDLGPSLEDRPVTSKVNLASVLSPSDDVLALFRDEKVCIYLQTPFSAHLQVEEKVKEAKKGNEEDEEDLLEFGDLDIVSISEGAR